MRHLSKKHRKTSDLFLLPEDKTDSKKILMITQYCKKHSPCVLRPSSAASCRRGGGAFIPRIEKTTITSCGVPIVLSLWKRHPGAATLVFYPGTMASPLLYEDLLTRLCVGGMNVVGIHPLSHGESPRIKRRFVFDDILRNGLDAVSWVLEHWGGPVAVAGHSQGGILTLAHAAADPRIAAAFSLCTLLPQHPRAGEVTRFARRLHHRERILHILHTADRFFPRLPVIIPMYLNLSRVFAGAESMPRSVGDTRLSYPLHFVVSLFTADLSAACTKGVIQCPLTVISARNDALFPPELMRTMLDCVKAPAKELMLLSGGGHLAPLTPRRAAEIAANITARCAGYGLPLVLETPCSHQGYGI